MEKLKEKLKMSYFIANKIYLFLIFIFLAIEDLTLGFYYFFIIYYHIYLENYKI